MPGQLRSSEDTLQPVAFVDTIHGNEPVGAEVGRFLAAQALPGVAVVAGHPAAVAAGRRFLTPNGRELGGLVPGDIQSDDPDQQAAGRLHATLKQLNPWIAVIHHHNNGQTPGSEFVAVGRYTRASILALAKLAGLRDVCVAPDYPLSQLHPEVVEVERIITPTTDIDQYCQSWLGIMATLAAGPSAMQTYIDPEFPRYHQRGGYFRLLNNGQPNLPVLKHLDELEAATAPGGRFTPLELSAAARRDLGLGDQALTKSSGNYANNSLELGGRLGIGAHSSVGGALRREVLGGYFVAIDPPISTGFGDHLAFTTRSFRPATN